MRLFYIFSGRFLISPGRSHKLSISVPHVFLSPRASERASAQAGFGLHLGRATCCSWPGGRCVSSKRNPLHSVTVAARTAVLPLRRSALCQNGDCEPSGPSQLSAGERRRREGGGRGRDGRRRRAYLVTFGALELILKHSIKLKPDSKICLFFFFLSLI